MKTILEETQMSVIFEEKGRLQINLKSKANHFFFFFRF